MVGPPAQPQVSLELLNETTQKLKWNRPYSPPQYNISDYEISVKRDTADSSVVWSLNTSQEFHFFSSNEKPLRDILKENQCTLFGYHVKAVSGLGKSQAGHTMGGFPMSKQSVNVHHQHYSKQKNIVLWWQYFYEVICSYSYYRGARVWQIGEHVTEVCLPTIIIM